VDTFWTALLEQAAEALWPLDCRRIAHGSASRVVGDVMSVRVSRLLRACAALIQAGYAQETAGLARSIWEDAVSTAFVAESPEQRAMEWTDFAEKRRIHHLNRALNTPDDVSPEILSMVREATTGQETSKSHYWSGYSPSVLAVQLSKSADEARKLLSQDFDKLYQDFCDDTHGSPFALNRLLVEDGDDAIVNVGPDCSRTEELALLALYGAWHFACAAAALGSDVSHSRVHSLVSQGREAMRSS